MCCWLRKGGVWGSVPFVKREGRGREVWNGKGERESAVTESCGVLCLGEFFHP